jgi:hypothetical protein
LSHNPFCLSKFLDGYLAWSYLGLASDHDDPPTSAPCPAGTVGLSLHLLAGWLRWGLTFFGLGWPQTSWSLPQEQLGSWPHLAPQLFSKGSPLWLNAEGLVPKAARFSSGRWLDAKAVISSMISPWMVHGSASDGNRRLGLTGEAGSLGRALFPILPLSVWW